MDISGQRSRTRYEDGGLRHGIREPALKYSSTRLWAAAMDFYPFMIESLESIIGIERLLSQYSEAYDFGIEIPDFFKPSFEICMLSFHFLNVLSLALFLL